MSAKIEVMEVGGKRCVLLHFPSRTYNVEQAQAIGERIERFLEVPVIFVPDGEPVSGRTLSVWQRVKLWAGMLWTDAPVKS